MTHAVTLVMASCICCEQLFAFNPFLVPSIEVEGVLEPLCRACVTLANPRRVANGLAPIVVRPGAYDAIPEGDWHD